MAAVSSWPSRLLEHRLAVATSLLILVTAAAACAAAVVSPVYLVAPIVLLPVAASWVYPKSVWPFLPLTTIVISPSIFVAADGEPFPYADAIQKSVLIVAGLCLALAFGPRWSWLGAAALTLVGIASLASILNIGGRVEVGSEIIARATAGYCVPFLFLFVNWRRLSLQRGLEYIAMLPLMCLVAGVVLQLAGVKGPAYRAPSPGIYQIDLDQNVPRLQGALIPAHLGELAVVALASALCLAASSSTYRPFRVYLWVVLNFVILLATLTRAEIAAGIMLMITFVVAQALGPGRVRSVGARRATWLLATMIVASCAIAAPAIIKRTTGSYHEPNFNTSGRKYATEFFYGFVAENPLLGKGLGFSATAVSIYSPPNVSEAFQHAPHNEYLRFTIDGGIFFAIGLFLVIISVFILAACAQSGVVRIIVIALAVGTLALSFVDNTFSTVQFSVSVIIVLGLLASHPHSAGHLPGRHRATNRRSGSKQNVLESAHSQSSLGTDSNAAASPG